MRDVLEIVFCNNMEGRWTIFKNDSKMKTKEMVREFRDIYKVSRKFISVSYISKTVQKYKKPWNIYSIISRNSSTLSISFKKSSPLEMMNMYFAGTILFS